MRSGTGIVDLEPAPGMSWWPTPPPLSPRKAGGLGAVLPPAPQRNERSGGCAPQAKREVWGRCPPTKWGIWGGTLQQSGVVWGAVPSSEAGVVCGAVPPAKVDRE